MIATGQLRTATYALAVLTALCYLSGYTLIRKDCSTMAPKFVVVPEYVSSNSPLRILYRPCFWLEHRCWGNQFSTTPWGMMPP